MSFDFQSLLLKLNADFFTWLSELTSAGYPHRYDLQIWLVFSLYILALILTYLIHCQTL